MILYSSILSFSINKTYLPSTFELIMMSVNNTRRCSGCNTIGHNIRSCIKNIDETIILEYTRRSFVDNTYLPEDLFVLSTNQLNKLCEKYGLSFMDITNVQKKERLHRIYLHLGIQRNLHIVNLDIQQVQQHIINRQRPIIYRPSYLPALTVANPSDEEVVVAEQQQQQPIVYDINSVNLIISQMIQLNLTRANRVTTKVVVPVLQIVIDKTKFKEKEEDIGECPVCYEENCCNMIVTDCNHSYCQPCISKLMNSINKSILPCPLCRENVKNLFVFSENSSNLMLQL